MPSPYKTVEEWAREAEELRARLEEAEETLRAIREGEVDSLLISTAGGERIYTLEGADHTYRILVESMQQGAATLLENGDIFYSNQHLARMLKTPLQQLIGASLHTFVHPADQALFAALVEQGLQCGSQGELRIQAADGALIPVYLAFNRLQLGERNGLCLAVTDLTTSITAKRLAQANEQLQQEIAERKRAEEELRRTVGLLNLAEHGGHVGSYECDIKTGKTWLSPEFQAIYGMGPDEWDRQHETWLKYIHPEDLPLIEACYTRTFDAQAPEFAIDFRVLRSDGQVRWITGRCCVSYDRNGAPLRLVGVNMDITERKQAEEELREREEALRQSEERLRSLGDNIPAGAIYQHVRRPDGNVQYAYMSAGIEKITGMTAEQVMAAPEAFLELIVEADRPRWMATEAQSAREGVPFDCEFRQRTVTGQIKWVHCRSTPHRLDDGSMVWDGVVTDITERKQAEEALCESEERFRTAFEKGAIAMALTALDNSLLQVNPVFCQMLGFAEAELVGRRFTDITHPDDVAENCTGTQRLRRGEISSFRMRKRYIRKDGRIIWGDMCTASVRDARGKLLYFVTHVQDITEHKLAEESLRKANEDLSEADRRKDEFLAMLAHELRNPLAPIRTAIHILRAVGTREPAAQRQHETIDRQVAHMARLLDDLLDVARVTRGKIELRRQPLALADVLLHVVETVTPLLRARRHTLHFEPAPDDLRVEGDLDRLAQAVGNLLINAAKYTEEGGQIWLEARRQNGQAVLSVRDTGVGIAPEMLPRVFDLFTQADRSLARTQGGLGIGLTMAKNLVEMHGGHVEAHSEGPGLGSEFIIRLPALPEERRGEEIHAQAPPPPEPMTAPTRRVLVVDDLADTADSLAELLTIWGHEVHTAHDGTAALAAVQAFRPEVVLLDIGMPGLDGFEVARRLRRMPETAGALLVALTGYGQTQDREETRAAGFDMHLVKPVDIEALRNLLTHADARQS